MRRFHMFDQTPPSSEYDPYFARYIERVAEGDLRETLKQQQHTTTTFFRSLDEETLHGRYEEGKWSPMEILGHLIDTERVFFYRALHLLRRDPHPLPGFDENAWAAAADWDQRPLASVLREYEAQRELELAFMEGLSAESWGFEGSANGLPISVRALFWINAGHELHHLSVIEERYLVG